MSTGYGETPAEAAQNLCSALSTWVLCVFHGTI